MTRCLDDATLLELAEGRGALDEATAEHLADCADCRRLFAAVARGAGATLRDVAPETTEGEPSWEELGRGVVVAGRYVLEGFLGAGGMGVVWAARSLDGDGSARVAVKVARAESPELRRRLEREARIAASLVHPGIVRTLEVLPATESRGPCLVQELLAGEPLETLLARHGRLPLPQAARATIAVAHALGAAHARGIVHRDLKPQNVFVCAPDGAATGPAGEAVPAGARVVVLDFGIAKLLPTWGEHSKLTRTGAVLGTPQYMAPEQVFGEADVDARADVWALGALLFRALCGRAPVEGRGFGEVVRELRLGRVGDLGALAPDVPGDVVALVRSALVMERDHRVVGVERFAEVLGRWT
jgi:serine/threonine protein kinase